MTAVLARWNFLPFEAAVDEILPCCGSRAWASGMARRRPVSDEAALLAASDETWRALADSDWLEAFRSHPRIGESRINESGRIDSWELETTMPRSSAWSEAEQRAVTVAGDSVKSALARGNQEYEQRFGRIFIVCATGKTPAEILKILERRLKNDERSELQEAANEQRQITQIRLRKWLQG